jgi:hypothetical protein
VFLSESYCLPHEPVGHIWRLPQNPAQPLLAEKQLSGERLPLWQFRSRLDYVADAIRRLVPPRHFVGLDKEAVFVSLASVALCRLLSAVSTEGGLPPHSLFVPPYSHAMPPFRL